MSDTAIMHRAIRLAMNGRGRVEPNPMVGCVIVKGGRVVGEGFHAYFGGPHAEPEALAACSESPAGGTAYVTLEPCCHTNKKTPPCVPRLIEAKLARVVIGCSDPNPDVDGQGIATLRAAGIAVDAPVLEAPCRQLIAPFIARMRHDRPYITLKWAQTADGKIAGPHRQRLQISSPESMQLVHRLRGRSDGILVGINTVLADDPLLTARDVARPRPSKRIVLDRNLRTPLNSRLVQSGREQPVVLFCSETARRQHPERHEQLRSAGITVESIEDPALPLNDVLRRLRDGAANWRGTHLIVEPGPALARSFFEQNVADRLWVFRSPRRLNDSTAPAAELVPSHFVPSATIKIGIDELTEYLNLRSTVCFAAEPSVDIATAVP